MNTKKILLIEDDEFLRDLYTRELDAAGFPTRACGDGKKGLAAAQSDKYDLILLDIMLPGINGMDILKRVRKDSPNKETKIILLTNLGQENVIKEAFSLGAAGYLIKLSYTPDQIIEEVKKYLST